MSSYHSSFSYLDKNSKNDFGWMIAAFDPDNGEMDSYLSQEQIYTDSYKGTKRILYGTRYDSVTTIKITVVKCNNNGFSVTECRDAYRWLTGKPQASWLDLYIGKEIQYSFLGTVRDVKPYKLDAKTIGLTIYFESVSPWAYSPVQIHTHTLGQTIHVAEGVLYNKENISSLNIDENGVLYNEGATFSVLGDGLVGVDNASVLTIDNKTDDLYTPIYLHTVFTNHNSDYLSIKNITTGAETILKNMRVNEVITMNTEQFISSDIPNKIFGDTFNFVWPSLVAGVNELVISGSGSGQLEFTYRYPIKISDCAIDLDTSITDSDCECDIGENNSGGGSVTHTVAWEDIKNKPTTIAGYGIEDAYTKEHIDSVLESFVFEDVYTKEEVDEMISNIDISDFDTYTKAEIDEMLDDVSVDNVYTKPEVDDKIAILESKLAELLYDDITITSLSNDVGTKEKGMVVDVTIKWSTSKEPTAITLGGVSLDPTTRSYVYHDISSGKSWTLVVTGERGEKATKSTSVSFYNGVYYGASTEPSEYNSDFILSLSGKTLSGNKVSPVNITTGDGQYMYYCLPTSMGECKFTVGGFVGGFKLACDPIEFENLHNHKEMYYIYRSDYPDLGLQNVSVS